MKGFNDIHNVEEFEQALKEKVTEKERILKISELVAFIADKNFNKTLQSTISDKSQKKSISSVNEPEELTKI